MKSHHILFFILSTIASLAVLCAFFPEGEKKIGNLTLDFPSLDEILIGEEEPEEAVDPEILLAEREAAILQARNNDYLNYFAKDPARIYFPEDKIDYLDDFFASLDRASSEKVRIVHYGDSQIEIDRISGIIRNNLQEKFGGGGPGILPVKESYYSLSIVVSSTYEPARYLVYGTEDMRGGNSRYGVMGQRFYLDSAITVTFNPLKNNTGPSRYFNRITLLSSGGPASVSCKGKTQKFDASENVRHIRFSLPDSTTRVSISCTGNQDIYGIILDNDKGVSLDNIPMRGCSGTIFTAISSAQLKDYFTTEDVRLIILQFGGNSAPYLKTDESIAQYCQKIERQIAYLQKLAPDAKILFIGPSDMSTKINGKMQTYPQMVSVVDALKKSVNNAGAAFWNMFEAMGGSGSMVKWVNNNPQLAGNDYIHFTPKGAEKMGGMFYESLMLYYDYYKFRTNNETK